MADCYRCGAEVEFVEDVEGRRFPVDVYESYAGQGRWVFSDDGRVEPLDPYADAAGHTEHRLTCASGAGPGERIDLP
jgi:hypothetical protein